MKLFSIRGASRNAITLSVALFALVFASTIALAQSSSPLESSPTSIATATDIELGELASSPDVASPASTVRNPSSRTAVPDGTRPGPVNPGTGVSPRTIEEWKLETAWPSSGVTAGNVVYAKSDCVVLLGTLSLDKPLHVAQELAAAKLNVSIGVASSCILETIENADSWLNEHPVGTYPTWSEYQVGSRLWWDLYRYNNGLSNCAPKQ